MITKILGYGLLFFCFFPFIGIDIGTDTQPFALIMSVILVLKMGKISLHDARWWGIAAITLLLMAVIAFFNVDMFAVAKRMFSYVSLMIIPIAVYNLMPKIDKDLFEKTIKLFIWIWFIIGTVQQYISRDFLTFLVPLYRTSATRGVCALASEPSFYGYMSFFMFIIAMDFKCNKILYMVLNVIQCLALAQSSVSLIYFFIVIVAYAIFKAEKNLLKKLLICCGIAVIIGLVGYIILTRFQGTRLFSLLNNFLNSNFEALENDESVMQRLDSIKEAFSNKGMPSFIGETTLMSGYGGAILEMGFFSVLLFIPITKAIIMGNEKGVNVAIAIAITISMFSAIQLSSPMFAFYIGYCYYKRYSNENMKLFIDDR